ncbi:MAG: DNA mismatch repair protein MutL, partial [Clostridia bacterium]|nr:DNA mismatch repair protein MutL [Clostridia bacterium]
GTVLVRAIPAPLAGTDVATVLQEVADSLLVRGSVQVERLDRIYHTVACKAATKAGYHSADGELLALAKRILADRDIMYCPHGRPVAFEIRKNDLEKYFGRIQ